MVRSGTKSRNKEKQTVTDINRKNIHNMRTWEKKAGEELDLNVSKAGRFEAKINKLNSTWSDLPRPRKRLTELMLKTALELPGEKEQQRREDASRVWGFRFFRSPVEVLPDSNRSRVSGIRLAVNKLEVKWFPTASPCTAARLF